MSFLERLGQLSQSLLKHNNGIRISYGSESLQFGELYRAAQQQDSTVPSPVVVLIHGGFWRASYGLSLMRGLARDLAAHGITAWNIEYRRVGDKGGAWPGTMLDVALATDFLRTIAQQYALDIQRVVTVGHSAGGHLALWVAARHHISTGELYTTDPLMLQGAVSLAGCVDLDYVAQLHLGNNAVVDLLGGEPQAVPDRYATASPAALVPLSVPQVLIHGTNDDRVPLAVSQHYAQKAIEAGDDITLIEQAGADHFVLIDPTSESWTITRKEVQRLFAMKKE